MPFRLSLTMSVQLSQNSPYLCRSEGISHVAGMRIFLSLGSDLHLYLKIRHVKPYQSNRRYLIPVLKTIEY